MTRNESRSHRLAGLGLGSLLFAACWFAIEVACVEGSGGVDLVVAALVAGGIAASVAGLTLAASWCLPSRVRLLPAFLLLGGVAGLVADRLTRGDWIASQPWVGWARGLGEPLVFLAVCGVVLWFAHAARTHPGRRRAAVVAALALLVFLLLERTTFSGRYRAWHLGLLAAAAASAQVVGWLVAQDRFSRVGARRLALLTPGLVLPFLVAAAGFWPGEDLARRDLVLRRAPLSRQVLPFLAGESAGPALDAQRVAEVEAALRNDPVADGKVLDRVLPRRRDFNLVLLSLDALRADCTSFGGGATELTPELARLAEEAVVFTDASTANSASPLAFASLFTGLVPSTVAPMVNARGGATTDGTPPRLLAERLQAAGRTTAAVTGYSRRFLRSVVPWISRGFQRFHREERVAHLVADEVAQHAIAALGRLPSDAPWLLWAHWFDPHAPYDPPKRYEAGDAPEARYRAEIRHSDAAIGRVLDRLRRRPDWERTLVVVTSDHGEEFLEHGALYHGHTLYQELVHVPLLVRVPGIAGRVVKRPVGLVDVTPTLLELLDLERTPAHGRSLVGELLPEALTTGLPERSLLLQIRTGPVGSGRMDALRLGDAKLVRDDNRGTVELYDLAEDPGEKVNLAAARPDLLLRLETHLAAWRRFTGISGDGAAFAADRPLTPEELRRALGGADAAARTELLARLDAPARRAAPVSAIAALLPSLSTAQGRCAGLAILETYGSAAVAPALLPCLEDQDTSVRVAACRAAGSVGDEATKRALASLRDDADPRVQRAAGIALALLGAGSLERLERVAGGEESGAVDAGWFLVAQAVAGDGEATRQLGDLLLSEGLPPALELAALRALRRLPRGVAAALWETRVHRGLPKGLAAEALLRWLDGASFSEGLPLARRLLGASEREPRDGAAAWLRHHLGGSDEAVERLRRCEARQGELRALSVLDGRLEEAADGAERAAEALVDQGHDDDGLFVETYRWALAAGRREAAVDLALRRRSAAVASSHQSAWHHRAIVARHAADTVSPKLHLEARPGVVNGPQGVLFDAIIELPTNGPGLVGGADPRQPRLAIGLQRLSGGAPRILSRALPIEGILPGERRRFPVMIWPGQGAGEGLKLTAVLMLEQRALTLPVSLDL